MKTVIIDYGAGNIASVKNAFRRIGVETIVSDNPAVIASADRVIFPGVGEAASALQKLKAKQLDQIIPTLQQPVLGICLGMQLMCNTSEEGRTKGLGIFDVDVRAFPQNVADGNMPFKVPHMGWNTIQKLNGVLFQHIPEEAFMYFVHGFFAPSCNQQSAACDYIEPFSAALQKDNFYGVQFHPEKSGALGQQLLVNFMSLN